MESILPIPKEGDVFENDRLDRKRFIQNLMYIINRHEKNCTILIDGAWGTGKTTLLRLLEASLRQDEESEYSVIRYNAWENDYQEDAFVPMVREINKELKNEYKLVTKASKVAECIGSNLALMLSKGVIDIQEIRKIVKGETESPIDEFKKEVAKIIKRDKKRIIYLIDELDRCRPTFAIETLERIKHILGVEGLYFIIALDKKQLTHSLKTVYGSGMNTPGYLSRFFDYEFQLENSDLKDFLRDHITDKDIIDNPIFLQSLDQISRVFDVSLRDWERIIRYFNLQKKNRNAFLRLIFLISILLNKADPKYYDDLDKKINFDNAYAKFKGPLQLMYQGENIADVAGHTIQIFQLLLFSSTDGGDRSRIQNMRTNGNLDRYWGGNTPPLEENLLRMIKAEFDKVKNLIESEIE